MRKNPVLVIPAEMAAIDRARAFLKDRIGPGRLSEDDLFQFDLALVEILINVIRYGFPDASGEIRVTLVLEPELIRLEIRDDGIPFDPPAAPEPAFEEILIGKRKGGLGIHLARSFADRMTYRREGRENILILEKKLSK